MFLSDSELRELTGRAYRKSQKQTLDAMGIQYKENGIGELVVSRKHVERVLGGEAVEPAQLMTDATPNFAALG